MTNPPEADEKYLEVSCLACGVGVGETCVNLYNPRKSIHNHGEDGPRVSHLSRILDYRLKQQGEA